jgi:hypothetical protein
MENIHNFQNWLALKLSGRLEANGCLCLDIVFLNFSECSQALPFSNRSFKAEMLSLKVFDEQGKAICPERRDLILLKNDEAETRVLDPGEIWMFRLLGELKGQYIEFRGAAYKIAGLESVFFKFVFNECESNIIKIVRYR